MLEPKKGKTKISGVYRVKQPMDNFKIRVRIVQQKSLLAELFENEGETRDDNFLEDEQYEFSWQEKLLAPYELKHYRDEGNCSTDLQKEYRRRVVEGPSETERVNRRLYSYVHDDPYRPRVNLLTNQFRSCLSTRNERATATLTNRKVFADRYNKRVVDEMPSDRRIRDNHYLYKEHRVMYIAVDLSPKDESNLETSDSEALLCALTYDPLRKTLRVNPDFTTDECYSVDGVGMSYDYWIEDASAKPTVRDLQRRRDVAKKDLLRLGNLKDSRLFHELHSPRARVLRLMVNLDIDSATNFAYDDALFVRYYVRLPEHWSSLERGAFGRTQRCRARDGVARFAHCVEIPLDLDLAGSTSERGNEHAWPSLLLSVASLDRWTRYRIEGYASVTLPLCPGAFSYDLETWRPSAGILDSLRRFFTGGTCELDDLAYCAVPTMHEASTLDKSKLRTLPSGSVQLRMSVVHQSQQQRFDCDRRRTINGLANGRAINAANLLNGVDDVLNRFKAARERMIQARAMCT